MRLGVFLHEGPSCGPLCDGMLDSPANDNFDIPCIESDSAGEATSIECEEAETLNSIRSGQGDSASRAWNMRSSQFHR